jgi:peptidyl-prolyl cis-trans isomerase C
MPKRLLVIWVLCLIAMIMVVIPFRALAADEGAKADDVAKVNGVGVTWEDFAREKERLAQQVAMSGQPVAENAMGEVEKRALDAVVNRELLYQASQKDGVQVEEKELDEKIKEVKDHFKTEDEYTAALANMKLSEVDLRKHFKIDLVIRKYIEKALTGKTETTEDKVKEYYEANPNYFKQPEQVKASHILVQVAEGADEKTKSEALTKIKGISERIKKGEDFAVVAKEVSDCPSKTQGGDLGFFSEDQMVPAFSDVAFSLKPGEVSGVVETKFGYHLIKSVDKKAASTVPFEQVKDRIKQYLEQEKGKAALSDLMVELKKTAKIEILLPLDKAKAEPGNAEEQTEKKPE